MKRQLYLVQSETTDPYENLAVEESLLTHEEEDTCTLYLWQNQNTVVIGRNQNAWKECNISLLEQEQGHLARRLSGGGAVYHDLGNVNFTFLARQKDYDVDRQLQVLLRAVNSLGLPAEKSGRNDLLIQGQKFSGNAFYRQGDCCYHHGTIMVNVDVQKLSRYLSVSQKKLAAKGVSSVKSRVLNLTDLQPGLTINAVKEAMIDAFQWVYQGSLKELDPKDLDQEELEEYRAHMASWDWKYGRKLACTLQLEHQFSWGLLALELVVQKGIVTDCAVYSDALPTQFLSQLPAVLKGLPLEREQLAEAMGSVSLADVQEQQLAEDLAAFVRSQTF